jgi:hypothetical protein
MLHYLPHQRLARVQGKRGGRMCCSIDTWTGQECAIRHGDRRVATELNPRKLIQRRERLAPGHRLCSGCGAPIIVRQVLTAIDEPVIVACATGCLEVETTIYPYTAWWVPWIHNAFEDAASTISGAWRRPIEVWCGRGRLPSKTGNSLPLVATVASTTSASKPSQVPQSEGISFPTCVSSYKHLASDWRAFPVS